MAGTQQRRADDASPRDPVPNANPDCGTFGRMGRGEPIRWERRTATLADGRTISWAWQPADLVEPDGRIIPHADVAAELLRSIGHPDRKAHRPHV